MSTPVSDSSYYYYSNVHLLFGQHPRTTPLTPCKILTGAVQPSASLSSPSKPLSIQYCIVVLLEMYGSLLNYIPFQYTYYLRVMSFTTTNYFTVLKLLSSKSTLAVQTSLLNSRLTIISRVSLGCCEKIPLPGWLKQ